MSERDRKKKKRREAPPESLCVYESTTRVKEKRNLSEKDGGRGGGVATGGFLFNRRGKSIEGRKGRDKPSSTYRQSSTQLRYRRREDVQI